MKRRLTKMRVASSRDQRTVTKTKTKMKKKEDQIEIQRERPKVTKTVKRSLTRISEERESQLKMRGKRTLRPSRVTENQPKEPTTLMIRATRLSVPPVKVRTRREPRKEMIPRTKREA